MMSLTKRQLQAFVFIEDRIAQSGVAPSYSEVAAALGTTSKGNVKRIVDAIIRRGHLRKLPGHARALEIVAPGEAKTHAPGDAQREATRLKQIEVGVRNIIFNVQNSPERYTVEVLLQNMRRAIGVGPDEKV